MNPGEIIQEIDEVDAVSSVGRMLSKSLSREVIVRAIHRSPSPYATSVPTDVLTVVLDNDEQVSLFAKHISMELNSHPEKQVRHREMLVYENLLVGADLPVVKYVGSRPDHNTASLELYLEYVDDWSLIYQSLDCWNSAARQLAHLHGHFATGTTKLLGGNYLLKLDQSYYWFWAHRARDAVTERCSMLVPVVADILNHYQEAIDLVVSQPATLVHNDLAPKNVIADRSASPVRICFIDWEMAGIGCGVLDLVHLSFGLAPEDEQRMHAAYRGELFGTGLIPTDPGEWNELVAACQLHKLIYRLAFSVAWDLPEEIMSGWVSQAADLLRRSGCLGPSKCRPTKPSSTGMP